MHERNMLFVDRAPLLAVSKIVKDNSDKYVRLQRMFETVIGRVSAPTLGGILPLLVLSVFLGPDSMKLAR